MTAKFAGWYTIEPASVTSETVVPVRHKTVEIRIGGFKRGDELSPRCFGPFVHLKNGTVRSMSSRSSTVVSSMLLYVTQISTEVNAAWNATAVSNLALDIARHYWVEQMACTGASQILLLCCGSPITFAGFHNIATQYLFIRRAPEELCSIDIARASPTICNNYSLESNLLGLWSEGI